MQFMSTLFVRTLRDDPADADVLSHRLLHRAGYIRRVASGGYAWLPLGWTVLRTIEQVVREEMERAGSQEVHLPALLPREPFDVSGRWDEYGDNLFRLVDRRGNDHLLAPTHEEIFTLLVKDLYASYRDLPLSIFQIQTKFRDELRPRGGLLRGREFVMKDSYSFDIDDDGLRRSYDAHREAYQRIFDRLGLAYVIVSAMSGAMGGSMSEEFLCPLDIGEDSFVRCTSCDYAANVEAVNTPAPDPIPLDGLPASHVEDTPDTATIESLVAHLENRDDLEAPDGGWQPSDLLKNVLVRLRHPDGETEVLAVGIPGDRALDPVRLESQVAPAVVEEFGSEDFDRYPTLVRGYIGPGVLGSEQSAGIRYLVDPRVVEGTRWVTGADEPGRHVIDLVYGRDFTADGPIEAAAVHPGDPCPRCGQVIEIARGVEIGHIFQLGRRYAEAFDLTVQGPEGRPITVTMGSYGIGISRVLAAIAETTADDKGLCWPVGVGPADVHIVVAGPTDEHRDAAVDVGGGLEAAGLRVLVDDRSVSPGVKFADAELIGIPTIIVVGRGLATGEVELRNRQAGTNVDVALDAVVATVVAEHAAALADDSA